MNKRNSRKDDVIERVPLNGSRGGVGTAAPLPSSIERMVGSTRVEGGCEYVDDMDGSAGYLALQKSET